MKRILFLVAALLLLPQPVAATAATVKVAEIYGAISPASAAYFLRALDEAPPAKPPEG
jgi:membrane-bound ClpP family serine protease